MAGRPHRRSPADRLIEAYVGNGWKADIPGMATTVGVRFTAFERLVATSGDLKALGDGGRPTRLDRFFRHRANF